LQVLQNPHIPQRNKIRPFEGPHFDEGSDLMATDVKPANKSSEKVSKFFREVKAEMKKVLWPTRKELISSTGIVIASVVVISLFIALVDLVFSGLLEFVLK
jgi:preprotein translocase subunit SecE